MTSQNEKRGFTLVELIVVIGMLMLLAGAISTSVTGAHRRAKIQQATVEAQEMTKAILSYENYGKGYSLATHVMESPTEANESSLGFILGKENMNNGQVGKMPVLFNASTTRSGKILDPWGNPYYVTIRRGKVDPEGGNESVVSHVTFPNYNRRPADDLNTGDTK